MAKNQKQKQTPWGDKILAEFPIFKGQHGFFARAIEKPNGDKYIEISKYGPKPVQTGKDGYYMVRGVRQRKYVIDGGTELVPCPDIIHKI